MPIKIHLQATFRINIANSKYPPLHFANSPNVFGDSRNSIQCVKHFGGFYVRIIDDENDSPSSNWFAINVAPVAPDK